MAIDWGALLPAQQAEAPALVRAAVQTHAPGQIAGTVGDDNDREAWEERAAIFEYEAGFDRATTEAMATGEFTRCQHADKWAARAGDDRRLCTECRYYRVRFCTIAKPGGLVSASRNYEPVPDLLRRCEGFAPLPDDPDQRAGVQRWNGLTDSKGTK